MDLRVAQYKATTNGSLVRSAVLHYDQPAKEDGQLRKRMDDIQNARPNSVQHETVFQARPTADFTASSPNSYFISYSSENINRAHFESFSRDGKNRKENALTCKHPTFF